MPLFVPGDLDLSPWPSNSSKRGTKHVFRVNLAQIGSAVPEIFHTQINNPQSDGTNNRTFRSSKVNYSGFPYRYRGTRQWRNGLDVEVAGSTPDCTGQGCVTTLGKLFTPFASINK